jgi:hypothetical protein
VYDTFGARIMNRVITRKLCIGSNLFPLVHKNKQTRTRQSKDMIVGGYEISDVGLPRINLSKIAILLGNDKLKSRVPGRE